MLKKLAETVAAKQEEAEAMRQAEMEYRLSRAPIDNQIGIEARKDASQLLKPLERVLFGKEGLPKELDQQLPPGEQAATDVYNAREYLNSMPVKGAAIGLQRAQGFLRELLLAPFALLAAGWAAWQAQFKSQRYEMFLMAEGERIWYWRNRMENERWFWEVFAWDRLAFPILCTVAYEYVVPNNFVLAVVVPAVFIAWQTGSFPGPLTLDFWLIAYFGLYKKCMGDVMWLVSLLFGWA